MATRASKTAAKKTATQPAAKKTATKQATPPARTPRKRTPRKQATPALTLVKPTDTQPETDTQVDTRPRLAVRRRLFVGPMGPHEQAAIRAALAAAALRLPVSVRSWNGSQAQLADGTLLIHNPGPDRAFTAHIACPHGSIHGYPITSLDDLKTARAITPVCQRRHADNTPSDDGLEFDWDKAIGHGVQRTSRLADGISTIRKTVADTQPMSTEQIAAHIAETAKEHPEP